MNRRIEPGTPDHLAALKRSLAHCRACLNDPTMSPADLLGAHQGECDTLAALRIEFPEAYEEELQRMVVNAELRETDHQKENLILLSAMRRLQNKSTITITQCQCEEECHA